MYGDEAKSNLSNTFAVSGVGQADSDVPRVAREMGVIQKLLAENRELAGLLEQRLAAVLRPQGPEANGGGIGPSSVPREVPCPLLGDLEEFESSLVMNARRLQDILNRLEV